MEPFLGIFSLIRFYEVEDRSSYHFLDRISQQLRFSLVRLDNGSIPIQDMHGDRSVIP